MQEKVNQTLYKELVHSLTEKAFLKNIKISKKSMLELLQKEDWYENIRYVMQKKKYSCRDIFKVTEKTLALLSEEPAQGWFLYINDCARSELFPENYRAERTVQYEAGRLYYLEILRVFLRYEKRTSEFDPKLTMLFLSNEEAEKYDCAEEYLRFTKFCRNNYIYEFMRIGSEITEFDTLGHISGVHFVAMHMAKQLSSFGVPIDLALVSGAAAGHDIGKYGCKLEEAKRIPYLHYYYTYEFFKRNNMPTIGHIATNHSTWDLELENLSVESLVLIYADFRVKGLRDETGAEKIRFYNLEESFHVILKKLDNVDEAKTNRYKHVYNKLKDFESYAMSLGVNPDLNATEPILVSNKDATLLTWEEVVEKLKYLAIEHNIALMSKFNSEESFSNIIEAARSEKMWKNIRAYINIFEEYFTYLTQKQKMITLNYLHELLMHREGDIRRQAADLIGNIIVHYDQEYRKEMPEGAVRPIDEISSLDLWNRTLAGIILPDHKVTEQHKRWIGYSLKIVVESVLKRSKEKEGSAYLKAFLQYFENTQVDDSTGFILIDAMKLVPLQMCSEEEVFLLIGFLEELSKRNIVEINMASLRFLKYYSEQPAVVGFPTEKVEALVLKLSADGKISSAFIKHKVLENLDIADAYEEDESWYTGRVFEDPQVTSSIFLENLKVATPWAIKAVNIELLLDQISMGNTIQALHVATHFSNLIKVSERVAVRHRAGKSLLAIAPVLSLDQRNEVVIELTKGLEIGEYEISKYIPEYLGQMALYLHPNELDEFIGNIDKLLESSNDKVGSVALNTLGVLIEKYPVYKERFVESKESYNFRRDKILGMLLKGLANYRYVVSQEAFLVIGQYIFGSKELELEEKNIIFQIIYKKMLTLIVDNEITELSFFNSAAALNHIYRFISNYIFENKTFKMANFEKVAFFPGTFDPFSLSHKGIVTEIRNLGFEVYLALDEFSWSKKTQPRMIRRKIISMSVADEGNVYLFPDDVPVNIANPEDVKNLVELFPDKEVYIVVGSDVIMNASSYKVAPESHSIHTLHHVVFRRGDLWEETETANALQMAYKNIKGKIVELKLPVHLEDISSTRIRENIDYNRDISNLIDSIAQNYIYDNSLYLREPQYKHILHTRNINFEIVEEITPNLIEELERGLFIDCQNLSKVKKYLIQEGVKAVIIRDGAHENIPVAVALLHHLPMADLYKEFVDAKIASYVRKATSGKILVIGGIFVSNGNNIENLSQLILTEALAYSLKNDFSYAICYSAYGMMDSRTVGVLERQGFRNINSGKEEFPIYTVDMKAPVTLFKNIETTIKEPFNRNEKILRTLELAHCRIQTAITEMYPGQLVISFDAGVMHHRLMDMVTTINGVPNEPRKERQLGPYMCVPFGKILRGMAVPNTVTKALHTEKMFDPEVNGFKIVEFPCYSPLVSQVRTIKSFNRPVILVDDMLHKGYRIKELDPIFNKEEVNINRIIVGILSGNGKDLMTIQGRKAESVYFIPNLENWFVESTMYPFIGGDSIERKKMISAGLISSINLMLPYVAPGFLNQLPKDAVYNFSMVCLENARDIMETIESEYQQEFEKNLTMNRLSEAVISPRYPDKGVNMSYDLNLAPSVYISNDIEKLVRLKNFIVTE